MIEQFIEKSSGIKIGNEADIAIDELIGIWWSRYNLRPDYLKEQLDKIQNCIDFMKTFCEVEE